MNLFRHILNQGYPSLSVIGMAKNAGKTVTLNYLIEEAYAHGVSLGLTSIGRDGETLDLVTKTDKPTIYAYEGTVIATAEACFHLATARLEILQVTHIPSAMGKIIIAKVKHEGYVQLAGPSTLHGVKHVMAIMQGVGAALVLVDGALDRKTLASPTVTRATLLATGAVVSRDMNRVIAETAHRVMLFQLKGLPLSLVDPVKTLIEERHVGLIGHTLEGVWVKPLNLPTALGAGKAIAAQLTKDTHHLVLPGSLGEKLLTDVLEVRGTLEGLTWVVEDATKIFIEPGKWHYLKKRGLEVETLYHIELAGVTVNPTAPEGYTFDSQTLIQGLQAKMDQVGVFDVQKEELSWSF